MRVESQRPFFDGIVSKCQSARILLIRQFSPRSFRRDHPA
jgi:hypothetical protein